MPDKSQQAQQTKLLREEFKHATQESAAWAQRRIAALNSLVLHLCPVKPGDRIKITDPDRARQMGRRIRDVLVVSRVCFHDAEIDATARNPLFILTFGPYDELAVTLGVLQMKRWFKVMTR